MKFLRKLIGYHLALRPSKGNSLSQRMRILNIIRHANENTPFYKGLYDKFLEHEQNLSDEEFFYAFRHLPIIDEKHLNKSNEEFNSDHLQNRPKLFDEHSTQANIIKKAFIDKDFQTSLPIKTSHEEDTQLSRGVDYEDANAIIQGALKSFKENGWKPGEPITIIAPASSFWTNIQQSHTKQLQRYFGLTVFCFKELDTQTVQDFIETLKATKSTLLVASPRVLTRISHIMHNENIEPLENLTSINVKGEYFLDCSKSFIQKMFPDSDIQTSYTSSLCGTIAHQKGLNSFDYNVLDDDFFVEQGPNNSILITTYKQRAFPLIRYALNDMGQIKNNEDGTQTIEFLEGSNSQHLVGADGYMYFASYFNHVINDINKKLHDPIIDFTLRHKQNGDKKSIDLNFIVQKPEKKDKIKTIALKTIGNVFSNYDKININFINEFDHDYTQELKLIEECNDTNTFEEAPETLELIAS